MLLRTVISDENGTKPDIIIHPRSSQPDPYRFCLKLVIDGEEVYLSDSHGTDSCDTWSTPCLQLWIATDTTPILMQYDFHNWLGMCDWLSSGKFELFGDPRYKGYVFEPDDMSRLSAKESFELKRGDMVSAFGPRDRW